MKKSKAASAPALVSAIRCSGKRSPGSFPDPPTPSDAPWPWAAPILAWRSGGWQSCGPSSAEPGSCRKPRAARPGTPWRRRRQPAWARPPAPGVSLRRPALQVHEQFAPALGAVAKATGRTRHILVAAFVSPNNHQPALTSLVHSGAEANTVGPETHMAPR